MPNDRRTFMRNLLGWAGIAALYYFFPFVRCPRAAIAVPISEENILAWKLVGTLRQVDTDSAKIVGRQYLRGAPAERSVPVLVNKIVDVSALRRQAFLVGDPSHCKKEVQRIIRSDFEQGRIVAVQGWILAETEGRLCALLALSGSTFLSSR